MAPTEADDVACNTYDYRSRRPTRKSNSWSRYMTVSLQQPSETRNNFTGSRRIDMAASSVGSRAAESCASFMWPRNSNAVPTEGADSRFSTGASMKVVFYQFGNIYDSICKVGAFYRQQ